MSMALSHPDYPAFLAALKERILRARISAARAVNRELILLYWDIGRGIVERQQSLGWGESVVELLARDLQAAFPEMRGFSARNLWYVRRLFAEYAEPVILQQLAAEIPWRHHMLLMDRIRRQSPPLLPPCDGEAWLEPKCPPEPD